MALKVGLVAAGMLLGMTIGAALGIRAADEGDLGGADLTGVDGSDQALTDSADVTPDLTVGSSAQLTGTWRALAQCESTLDPRAVSANGLYFGLFQFDRQAWASVDGLSMAPRADLATASDQLTAAKRLQARRGWAPWPACSKRLGLR